LQRLARIASQLIVQCAHESVGTGDVGVPERSQRQADQVAVRCERHPYLLDRENGISYIDLYFEHLARRVRALHGLA
jgi:hypothetical protein